MQEQIIAIYCICDDCLKSLGAKDDPQAKMSNAEVLTTALIAAYFFGGCWWRAQLFLKTHHYFPKEDNEFILDSTVASSGVEFSKEANRDCL